MANRIRQIREQRKADGDPSLWTQAAVARGVGASKASVKAWESETARPSGYFVIRLARLLGVTVEELELDDREGIEGVEEAIEVPTPPSEESST